jgi:hypothetical protein
MEGVTITSITLEITGIPAQGSTTVLDTETMIKTIRTLGGRERKMTSFRWAAGTITPGSSADTNIKTNPRIGITIKACVNSLV